MTMPISRTTFAAILTALLGSSVDGSNTPPVDEIARRVQARYDETSDFTADVRHEIVLASSGKTVTATGTVAFKRPGKMRWVLDNHERQEIVADGSMLWFYQVEEKQVLRAPFQSAFRSSTPISFLTGVGRLMSDFKVDLDGATNEFLFLQLAPKENEGELGKLRLMVDRESFDVVGAEVRDSLGNVTRIHLSHLQRNTGVPDEQFRFDPPPGVDVVDAPISY